MFYIYIHIYTYEGICFKGIGGFITYCYGVGGHAPFPPLPKSLLEWCTRWVYSGVSSKHNYDNINIFRKSYILYVKDN